MLPWTTIATAPTREGSLELRRRGDDAKAEYIITIGGRVLMNSHASGSEIALSRLGLGLLPKMPSPRVLIGGLGMGITLRAALDLLPPRASVVVGELDQTIVDWCKGPLAPLTRSATSDPRVRIALGDVARLIWNAKSASFDAILLDLYEGPNAQSQHRDDPFYGPTALETMMRVLSPGGVLAVWAEDHDAPFQKRFVAAGYENVYRHAVGQGGRKHVVYVGTVPKVSPSARPRRRG